MRNEKFWMQSDGKMRLAVRKFIENHENTCGLSDIEQYQYEDDLMQFIESIKEDIYREVEKEYHREDVFMQALDENDERCQEIAMLLPIDKIDGILKEWDDSLSNNDGYWDYYWASLTSTLKMECWWQEYEEYGEEDFSCYKAYIEYWYSTHQESAPVSIEEFLNNEMQDEDLAMFYKGLAEKKK